MSPLKRQHHRSWLATLLMITLIATNFWAGMANAGVISTQATVNQVAGYDRTALAGMLATEESRQQLLSMGVSPEAASERLASLTDAELAQFNQQLQEAPVGEGAAGVLLTIFIVFVITDMLCATDVFGFVKCINK